MGTLLMGTGGSGVGSKVLGGCIGMTLGYPGGWSVWDGLWRPGGAFFQIDCVMSHHPVTTQKGSGHSCSNFGGKIKN